MALQWDRPKAALLACPWALALDFSGSSMKIQSIPVPDSPPYDALESVVELYFQINGYITSSGKWFWVWDEKTKKQRGYQDLDVIAIGQNETLLISVSSNLDDKAGFNRDKEFDAEKLIKLKSHFERGEAYLKKVPQYSWLVRKPRSLRRVVAYNVSAEKAESAIVAALKREKIEAMSVRPMIKNLVKYASGENIKVQDPLMRLLKVVDWHGEVKI
jgi:Holliday junction resolvase